MDSKIDVEALRAKLKAMSRSDARRKAIEAGLFCSTVEKFRNGHITEPRLSKLQKLQAVLEGVPAPKRRKVTRSPDPSTNP